MTTAEIITIGTELLLGETVDTNTRFIARALRDYGVDVYRTLTIGDNHSRIVEAIREALQRANIIITTGGLGPTVDDPTRQAVATAVGAQLEYHEELWAQVTSRLSLYGRIPGENQKRQAYVPAGARILENPVGTAPAFIVETPDSAIICLPGVPREMETLLTRSVIPYLQGRFGLHEVIKVRVLHIGGVGESWVDERIGDLEVLSNPTVGLAAHSGIIDLRIAAKAESESKAMQMIGEIEQIARQRLGKAIYGVDGEKLEQTALDAIQRRGWKMVAMEGGTQGALSARLRGVESPALVSAHVCEAIGEPLEQVARSLREKGSAGVALVLSVHGTETARDVDIFLLTPESQQESHLKYGGHPMNAPRWACNMALDLLRRTAG
jgi:competence/damage-inducible protein CinA-like protein